MGTIERGESNLSFKNIAKIAATLNMSLSELFQGLEGNAKPLYTPSSRIATAGTGKRRNVN